MDFNLRREMLDFRKTNRIFELRSQKYFFLSSTSQSKFNERFPNTALPPILRILELQNKLLNRVWSPTKSWPMPRASLLTKETDEERYRSAGACAWVAWYDARIAVRSQHPPGSSGVSALGYQTIFIKQRRNYGWISVVSHWTTSRQSWIM